MAEHPYISTVDRIGALTLEVQEKAILWCLSRHGDWSEGTNAFPSQATISRFTGLSVRQVRFWLADLRCDPFDALVGLCRGGPKCRHRGLIVLTGYSGAHRTPTYALLLDAVSQPPLPEIMPSIAAERLRRDGVGVPSGRQVG